MVKRYCDLCKREIDKYGGEKETMPFYRGRAWENIDMCLDCKEKWNDFKENTSKKYDKLYDDLYKAEYKEVREFLHLEDSGEEGLNE